MHSADEEPGPESSDRWRIQAEQMPPLRKVVDTPCQISVYVCCPDAFWRFSHLVHLKIFLD
jgi:hypothetical protein